MLLLYLAQDHRIKGQVDETPYYLLLEKQFNKKLIHEAEQLISDVQCKKKISTTEVSDLSKKIARQIAHLELKIAEFERDAACAELIALEFEITMLCIKTRELDVLFVFMIIISIDFI